MGRVESSRAHAPRLVGKETTNHHRTGVIRTGQVALQQAGFWTRSTCNLLFNVAQVDSWLEWHEGGWEQPTQSLTRSSA